MRLYLSYSAGYPMSFEEFVVFASRHGFCGVELIPDLAPNLPELLSPARLDKLVKLGEVYKINYTVHNIYMDINLTSLVPEVRYAALAITRSVLSVAKAIGASWVVTHTGYRFGPWRNKAEQAQLFDELLPLAHQELADCAADIGMPVLLENGSYYLCTRFGGPVPLHIGIQAGDLLELARLPSTSPFGICLDIGKAYASIEGDGPEPILEFAKVVYPLLRELHVSAFPGYEDVLPRVLNGLLCLGYNGPVVLECGRQDLEALLAVVRSI